MTDERDPLLDEIGRALALEPSPEFQARVRREVEQETPAQAGLRWAAVTWAMLGLGIVGSLAVIGGMIAGLVSWIGALLNTSQLESKTWFLVLLLLGIFSFGVIAMLAYVIAGPDGALEPAPGPAQASA